MSAAADRLALAPMAGLTGSAFRRLIRWIGGCGTVYTEFVSSAALIRHSDRSRRLLRFEDDERPIFCQIFGADAYAMAESARIVESLGADGVDINAGCPVPKVVKQNAGAAMLRDPGLCSSIFTRVVKSVSIPVSLKMRAGLGEAEACFRIGRIAQESGICRLTLHPRTASQGYGGRADWSLIARLKSELTVPVFGNGDVTTAEQAVELLTATGADGVMIGRGAVANPTIFAETSALLDGGSPSVPDRGSILRKYMLLLMGEENPFDALNHFKQFTAYFTKGVTGGAEFRRAVNTSHDLEEISPLVEALFVGAHQHSSA
ncbi:MAG: tRNA-dihydrouridine synthase [Acidobacteria bacterium]|nr:tRNA-dihydrouridine synthase [Acidobacteriota bacterium]